MSLRRTDLKIRIALVAATTALAAAPTAAAEEETEVVPPDNSAVNQYTETFPTGGGERDVNKGRRQQASPKRVLGNDNAKKLEKHGSEGRAVAEVAAETAPPVDKSSQPREEESETGAAPPAGGGNDSGGGGGADREGQPQAQRQETAPAPADDPNVDIPAGSSGISEVLAQATGSTSDGELGPLLPLVILAALGWAIALLLRRRPDRATR